MFGAKVDYLILRPFSHCRNKASEEELDAGAGSETFFDSDKAVMRLKKLMTRLEGRFSCSENLRYLDVGCGTGDITIAMTLLGARDVTGIDIVPRNIAAAERYSKQVGMKNGARFICGDVHRWEPDRRFDVVLSHEALEHIHDPKAFLKRLAELVKPNGTAFLAFGPLFHSPLGDHMWGFFRVQIPWRGVLFSERAIMRLRRERYRPTDPSMTFQDLKGGLNRMRYSEFLRYVDETGWEFKFLSVNPQLKRYPLAGTLSNLLVHTPLLKDYFAASVYAELRRR